MHNELANDIIVCLMLQAPYCHFHTGECIVV